MPRFSVLTLAFGTTPPDASVTVPPIAPSVVDCALPRGAAARHIISAETSPIKTTLPLVLFMEDPPWEFRIVCNSAQQQGHRLTEANLVTEGASLFESRGCLLQLRLVARTSPKGIINGPSF